ncbi:hypothetical protein M948_09595 [Virgibacillus sp. CM-4]|uniref:GNAT family N-acetyltransferase n=1 Tax=Virgibacillus sp. CM-4 TaxID=1354277 RepID=UPI0003888260|nr:GNAT family N-acetyltransferase [Virgibacillus sp. CM-4]EQB37126.1 hypothetical protein M948_09595 [Virgibacillus sp. CM-4]
MVITYKHDKTIDKEPLICLYNDVHWTAYTKDIPLLQQALLQSEEVISAWDGEQLVGLIRAIGDRLTIIYIQDLLVLTAYQKQGIGTQLMQMILKKYQHVRQKVLLTEDAPDVRYFYEKNGFQSCDRGSAIAFAKIN